MKEWFGLISLVLALAGYAPYIKDIFAHKTKPHAFSWLVWATLAAIAFAIQLTHNAGAGAWLMGITTAATLFIFGLSIRYGERRILPLDWLSLVFAGLALFLWFLTDRPFLSVILITLIDSIGGFVPTIRKSITNPHQETVSLYFIYGVSLCFSLLALRDFSFVNSFYSASFIFIDWGMGTFLLLRRRNKNSL